MNLFLIENDRTVDSLQRLPAYDADRDAIVCFNYLPYLRLKKAGGKRRFFFIEDFFTQEDYEALHSASDRFSLQWYRREGRDCSRWAEVSYGEIVRTAFSRTYMITTLLKYGELINKAIKKWPELKHVYFDFSVSDNSFCVYADDRGRFFNKQRLVAEVCSQLMRSCSPIVPDVTIPSQYVLYRHSHSNKAFIYLIKNLVKNFFMKRNACAGMASATRGNTYVFCYFNMKTMLDHMKEGFIVSSSDVGIVNWHRFPRLQCLRFEDMKYALDANEQAFLTLLKKTYLDENAERYYEELFTYNGIDYRFLYMPVIRDLISTLIPDLLAYVGKVKKAVKRFGISKIVIFEEVGEKFQAIIEASKSAGVTSVWLDHGIQGCHDAQRVYDRGRSDQIICAGDFFPTHYRSKGAHRSQYVMLGNPILDNYPREKRRRVSSIDKVLFLSFDDSFYSRLDRFVYQEKYYAEIFSIFEALTSENIKIYFKPHPGSRKNYFDYLFNFFGVDASKVVYVAGAPFSKIVYNMDLVVSNLTSCFYEAQAAGVPTVFMEPHFKSDALLPPLNGINGEEVLRVSSGKELLDLIMKNRDDTGKLNSFLDNFLNTHAEKYMGTLDGMSGKRIVEFLSRR